MYCKECFASGGYLFCSGHFLNEDAEKSRAGSCYEIGEFAARGGEASCKPLYRQLEDYSFITGTALLLNRVFLRPIGSFLEPI